MFETNTHTVTFPRVTTTPMYVCREGKSARRITIFIWSTAGGWVVVMERREREREGSCGDFDFAQTEKRSRGKRKKCQK